MKKPENCNKTFKTKTPLNILLIFFSLSVPVILFIFKNSIYEYLSKSNVQQNYSENIEDTTTLNNRFNYKLSKLPFSLTFLEFGSTGCIECKKMEKVIEEIKLKYKDEVNVVFYNVRLKENKKIAEHYKIQMIPVQILLDKSGKEYFRHLGYISVEELEKHL